MLHLLEAKVEGEVASTCLAVELLDIPILVVAYSVSH